jgi:septum formation protein
MKQLILASTSKYRQELLSRLPLSFTAMAPAVNEDEHKNKGLAPLELAQHLSQLKARSLKGPGRIVIGSDQLVNFNGKILGKPGSREQAIKQLLEISGKIHELITAVCIWDESEEVTFTDKTYLTLKNLSKEEIERYIDIDKPLDCAGAYKIEKAGISLMSEIKSEDFTAIQGLPLIKLCQILRQKGLQIP